MDEEQEQPEQEQPEQEAEVPPDTNPEEVEGDEVASEPPSEPGPSLYNFDLMTPEGVNRIVALLPILDESIVKALYQEVFPGYPLDNIAPRVARIELRGFFMDFLSNEASA